ncbi:MAG: thioredoxin family protein [Patescibacteria group bacterium]
MTIKILGSGCPKCQKLEQHAQQAVQELELKDAKVEHVFDMEKIIEYGVMTTPAIVINDEIKASGAVPEVEEIKAWLENI